MAGHQDAAEGSRTRRHVDLNLYVGLLPLPPPRVWLDTSAASSSMMPAPRTGAAAPQVPRTGEPVESLAPAAAVYSPWNALSTPDPEEHPMFDPIVYSWLDGSSSGGEEYIDAPQPAPAPVNGANVSGSSQLPLVTATGFEWDDLLARSVHPSRVAAGGGGMEMSNFRSTLIGQSSTQAAAAATPERRFMRAINVRQQHIRLGIGSAANRNHQEAAAASADTESLVRAIHTQSSFEAARRHQNNPDDGSGDDSSFECPICLELPRQPVVTTCGHLFCWPCLYQWIHNADSLSFCECPVCKGEVLRGDITPIYGRGGEEQGQSSNPNLPPMPQARRRESLRQQLHTAPTSREMGRVLRQLVNNQMMSWDAIQTPAETASAAVAAARQRAVARRQQQRQVTNSSRFMQSLMPNVGNVASGSSDPVQLPHSSRFIQSLVPNVGNVASGSSYPIQLPHPNVANAQQVVLAAPQQPPPSVDEAGPSRRSRPSESPAIRRTRRRPQ